MTEPTCNVCSTPLGPALYASGEGRSLTSLCRIHPGATSVHACGTCGHLQTRAMDDVAAYYDADYDILVDSEDEDQVYEVRGGVPLYRTAHQVATLRSKLDLQRELEVLDYGCAKSSTLRALAAMTPGLAPHLFDVSARYIPFWEKFAAPAQWAVNTTPDAWQGKFDLVTSLFSLEHIPGVTATMRHIHSLIKPGGNFYAIVPNVLGNVADFIVVDHCNHFTLVSLQRALADAGLEMVEIDENAHRGAFVILARKPIEPSPPAMPGPEAIAETCARLSALADYWSGAAARVRGFEAGLPPGAAIAVYGAGFYGAFIASSLVDPGRIACHLDQNPYLQGRSLDGRPVLAPADLPNDVATVLVGLNPAHARDVIAGIPALGARNLEYFYL